MIKIDRNKDIDIDVLFEHYRFKDDDISKLKELEPIAKDNLDRLIDEFYQFLFSFKYANMFLHKEETKKRHELGIREWFMKLFSGNYDREYIRYLANISETHVKIGLPSHYVNTAFSFVREFLLFILLENDKQDYLVAMHKIIDINLDLLSLSYYQENHEHLINEVLLIKNALSDNSIVPFVQPIIPASEENSINKFESLMRLPDKNGDTLYSIYPILQTAKKIHLYNDLMKQMISKTFDVFRELDYTFSINISYEDISDTKFCDFLFEKLSNFPNPNRIIFELLETDLIEDFELVISFITKIKKFGCQVAIDDFGSGYSNMENILKLKPDYIKIDGSLIKHIDTSKESYTIVKNIISMAKELNAKTVAEFVHNQEVYQQLKALNIDYFQGYYTGMPFSSTELPK